MRIICTLNDQSKSRLLSSFLAKEGIDNQLEIVTNTDWGNSNYGDTTCRLWVYDEDQVETALKWVDLFEKDPNNPVFKKAANDAPVIPVVLPKETTTTPLTESRSNNVKNFQNDLKSTLTSYLILICCILFFIDSATSPQFKAIPNYLPAMPILSSPLKKQMLYDYPQAYEIVDKLVKLYGVEKLQTPQDLPEEGQYLLKQFQQTPYWQGIYTHFLTDKKAQQSQQAPLFEKIKQGEVWRIFTPCLMHHDILHLLFNMLWLVVLGKQIEQRLSVRRYALLIFLAGVFSNTCQYLMTGANFLGFSGVLCAMLTFIWMRQKYYPWEGYPLEKSTIAFMMIFILAMFSIQVLSFYMESFHQTSISPGIANTAHLSGAALGLVFGRLSFFSWKR